MNRLPVQSSISSAAGDPKHMHVYQPTVTAPMPTWHPLTPDWDPMHLVPKVHMNSFITTGVVDPWNLKVKADRIEAQIDVPGCKAENIELTLTNGTLSVKATRTLGGNGGYSSFATNIGHDYDPTTASADVADGVLTVTVMRLPQKSSHKIVVKAR